jgi:hypothetical protein
MLLGGAGRTFRTAGMSSELLRTRTYSLWSMKPSLQDGGEDTDSYIAQSTHGGRPCARRSRSRQRLLHQRVQLCNILHCTR